MCVHRCIDIRFKRMSILYPFPKIGLTLSTKVSFVFPFRYQPTDPRGTFDVSVYARQSHSGEEIDVTRTSGDSRGEEGT